MSRMSKWKPKVGETYYMPWLYDCDVDCIDIIWNGTSLDEKRYATGFVCRTMKEALELARKMLNGGIKKWLKQTAETEKE